MALSCTRAIFATNFLCFRMEGGVGGWVPDKKNHRISGKKKGGGHLGSWRGRF